MHVNPSITLRVYSHWLPDHSFEKLVDALDDTAPRGPQTAPVASTEEVQKAISGMESVVSRVGIEPTTRRLRVCKVTLKANLEKLSTILVGPLQLGPRLTAQPS